MQNVHENLARLPLPVAQLCRRAVNGKTPFERHQAAYYAFEAALKTLGAVCVVEYAELDARDENLDERLHVLARPSLGQWWELIRRLLPVLARVTESPFASLERTLQGPARDDLPNCARLDSALLESLDEQHASRSTVQLKELIDRLILYRNREAHGALGTRPDAHYDRLATILRLAVVEFCETVDVLAGGRLLCVWGVNRLPSGRWRIEQFEFTGETPRRLPPLEISRDDASTLPRLYHLYAARATTPIQDPRRRDDILEDAQRLSLNPLLVLDNETEEVMFLNCRRGRTQVEYLSYVTGKTASKEQYIQEQRELLARVLRLPVENDTVDQWAKEAEADASDTSDEADSAARDDASLRRVGEFALISKLGAGGMGDVYRAWQPSLRRQVALKSMRGLGDRASQRRFQREIQSLGRVEHPHLVKIYTSGADADRWFYAMELVEGATLGHVQRALESNQTDATTVSLDQWKSAVTIACDDCRDVERSLSEAEGLLVDEAHLPDGDVHMNRKTVRGIRSDSGTFVQSGATYVERVVELLRQVADAAHVLHEAGIVHRDIKPGNIMVSQEGADAVLMDLGLAKFTDDEDELTRTRQFVGSLRYASPEQVLSARDVDRRSDVYSIGVILWELLTHRPMYGVGEDTPTPEIMHRVQTAEAESIRKYQRQVPADLEAIVLKCLEKNPARRYQSAGKLADDIASWQRAEPVLARRRTALRTARRFVRKRWRIFASASVLVVAAVAMWTVATSMYVDPYVAHRQEEIRNRVARITSRPVAVATDPHPNTQRVDVLPPENHTDFEPVERDMVWDLRAWKPVPSHVNDQLVSPAVLTQRIRLRKLKETDFYRTEARTTGADIFFRSPTHDDSLRVLACDVPTKVGGVVGKSRMSDYDVSDVPLNSEFTIESILTFWNGFRSEDDLWVGATVKAPTSTISFLVIMPRQKPMLEYTLRVAEIDGDRLGDYSGQQFVFEDPDGRYLFWEIVTPETNLVYRVDWKW